MRLLLLFSLVATSDLVRWSPFRVMVAGAATHCSADHLFEKLLAMDSRLSTLETKSYSSLNPDPKVLELLQTTRAILEAATNQVMDLRGSETPEELQQLEQRIHEQDQPITALENGQVKTVSLPPSSTRADLASLQSFHEVDPQVQYFVRGKFGTEMKIQFNASLIKELEKMDAGARKKFWNAAQKGAAERAQGENGIKRLTEPSEAFELKVIGLEARVFGCIKNGVILFNLLGNHKTVGKIACP